jgi:predicted Holliday junction resolvase-like endonuclease
LPIKENGSDYLPIHVIFILIWLLFLLRVLTFNEEFQAAKNNIESSPQEVIEEYRKSLQEPPQGIIEESNKELIEIQETKDLNSLNN